MSGTHAKKSSSPASSEPIRAYHGSDCVIEKFDYEFTDQGNDQLGSGFYFSTDEQDARIYALQGDSNPTMHVVDLNIKNPMTTDLQQKLSLKQVRSIIEASPSLDEQLENFGDIGFLGREKVLQAACKSYSRDGDLLSALNCLANDFFPGEIEAFNKAISAATGFDGVMHQHPTGVKHYVAWFPEQISVVEVKPVERLAVNPPKRGLRP